jgi:hypothetical protein
MLGPPLGARDTSHLAVRVGGTTKEALDQHRGVRKASTGGENTLSLGPSFGGGKRVILIGRNKLVLDSGRKAVLCHAVLVVEVGTGSKLHLVVERSLTNVIAVERLFEDPKRVVLAIDKLEKMSAVHTQQEWWGVCGKTTLRSCAPPPVVMSF